MIDEASDRVNGRVRCLEEYLKLTKPSAGGNPACLTAEVGLHIPNKVMEHTALQSILDFGRKISCPHKRGYFSGLMARLTVMVRTRTRTASGKRLNMASSTIMKEMGADFDGVLNCLAEYREQALSNFQAQHRFFPDVSAFVERLAYWIRWIDCWSEPRRLGQDNISQQRDRT